MSGILKIYTNSQSFDYEREGYFENYQLHVLKSENHFPFYFEVSNQALPGLLTRFALRNLFTGDELIINPSQLASKDQPAKRLYYFAAKQKQAIPSGIYYYVMEFETATFKSELICIESNEAIGLRILLREDWTPLLLEDYTYIFLEELT